MKKDKFYIEQSMRDIVKKKFEDPELKNITFSFLDIKNKGKYVFGNLTLLHYRMFGGNSKEIFKAAAAIELMILALDIFDDLQDTDQPTMPWSLVDKSLSLNVSIGLLTLSQNTLLQLTTFDIDKKRNAMKYLNEQVIAAVNGQHKDLVNLISDENEYLDMVKLKSGSLIACACLIGTSLATNQYHDEVKNYAHYLGIIEQIENDIRDMLDLENKNDLLNKKKTLLIFYLLENNDYKGQIIRDYFKGKISRQKMQSEQLNIKDFIVESGAIEYANIFANLSRIEAEECISLLPIKNRWREQLLYYIWGLKSITNYELGEI